MDLSSGWELVAAIRGTFTLIFILLVYWLPSIIQNGINHSPKNVNIALYLFSLFSILLILDCITMMSYSIINTFIQKEPANLFQIIPKHEMFFTLRIFQFIYGGYIVYYSLKIGMNILRKTIRPNQMNKFFKALFKSAVCFYCVLALQIFYIKFPSLNLEFAQALFAIEIISRLLSSKLQRVKNVNSFLVAVNLGITLIISIVFLSWKIALYISIMTFLSAITYFKVIPSSAINKHRISWI